MNTMHEKNRENRDRYNITAWFYDILDYPWELQYRKWRPQLLDGLRGDVLEAGVGTGRNLRHYPPSVTHLTALDHVRSTPGLTVTATRFIKHDTYLLIEGVCEK